MWIAGLLLFIVGASGAVWFGFFGLVSGSGAIAGLLAPKRISAEARAENVAFLKQLCGKVVTGLIACGIGWALMEGSKGTPLENAQEVADRATQDAAVSDARALAAASDGCAFQLFGRLRAPAVKKAADGSFVVGAFLKSGAGPQGLRNAAALALCVHRAGKERNLQAVVVVSPSGSWKLTREALARGDGWEQVNEAAAQRAILQLERVETPAKAEPVAAAPKTQVAPSLNEPEPQPEPRETARAPGKNTKKSRR